jgi:Uma2 family endonuclease
MLHGIRLHRNTYADYVAIEMASAIKHEFLDGEIYAMAGGSEEHSALAAAVVRALGNAIGDRPCRVHTSDLRIFIESVGLATFPDASVVCGPLRQHAPGPAATALNPAVLVEVTSNSSEEYDQGPKLAYYRTIPSLCDYVVISHRERRITVHSRRNAEWVTHSAIGGGVVMVSLLEASLAVDEIYRGSAIE